MVWLKSQVYLTLPRIYFQIQVLLTSQSNPSDYSDQTAWDNISISWLLSYQKFKQRVLGETRLVFKDTLRLDGNKQLLHRDIKAIWANKPLQKSSIQSIWISMLQVLF